jgi:hypothetical protein
MSAFESQTEDSGGWLGSSSGLVLLASLGSLGASWAIHRGLGESLVSSYQFGPR